MSRIGKTQVRLTLPRDPLLRLIVINGVAGIGIAGLVLGGLFVANIGNLRVLVLSADDPVLPLLMLAFGMVITLGSVVIGSAIMLLGGNNSQGGTPLSARLGKREMELQPLPVPVSRRRPGNRS